MIPVRSRRAVSPAFSFSVLALALAAAQARGEPGGATPEQREVSEAKVVGTSDAGQPALEAASKAEPTSAPTAITTPAKPPATSPVVVTVPAIAHVISQSTVADEEIRSLLKIGVSMTDRSDYDAAEIAFRQVLRAPAAKPTDLKTALLGLARMYRKQGGLTKAAAVYQRFLKDYPVDERAPDALLELGRTLRDMGATKLALSSFYNVINSTLKLPGEGFEHYQLLAKTAQFEIAETHFQSGDFASAAKFFTRLRLLDLAPADRARAHFKAANSLILLGDMEASIASLRDYLDQWPDDENVPEARYLLATSYRQLKRPQEAFAATLALLQTAKSRMKSDPKRWAYWQRRTGNQLANDFFESGDIQHAEAIYTGLAALSDDPLWQVPVTYQIGLCRERLGDADQARTAYKTILNTPDIKSMPDLAELVRMAAWREANLDWREGVNRELTGIFSKSSPSPDSPAATKKAPGPVTASMR